MNKGARFFDVFQGDKRQDDRGTREVQPVNTISEFDRRGKSFFSIMSDDFPVRASFLWQAELCESLGLGLEDPSQRSQYDADVPLSAQDSVRSTDPCALPAR